MKILAKSILNTGQIAARKPLQPDGIEILLFGPEIDSYHRTRDWLSRLADDFGILGIEAPDTVRGIPVHPTSDDVAVREHSRAFLEDCVQLANDVWHSTGAPVYFQYQYLYDRLNPDGTLAHNPDRVAELRKVSEYHAVLEAMSEVSVQLENTTPLCAGFGQEKILYSRPVTARIDDFVSAGIPLALDVVHLAETLYTWAQARQDKNGFFVIDQKRGKLYFPAVSHDLAVGERLRKQPDISAAISELIATTVRECTKDNLIGSLQFANAQPGFAVSHENEGHSGSGLIDVPLVLGAAVEAGVPYIIPEYREDDYSNPVNQRSAFELLKAISAK